VGRREETGELAGGEESRPRRGGTRTGAAEHRSSCIAEAGHGQGEAPENRMDGRDETWHAGAVDDRKPVGTENV
jgi:hypothetical protein